MTKFIVSAFFSAILATVAQAQFVEHIDIKFTKLHFVKDYNNYV